MLTPLLAQLAPPLVVMHHLATVKPIDKLENLPTPIRDGAFSVDGVSAAGWKMSDPGGPFSATDVPVPGAPGRRLVFAACDAQLCLLHYERGGIAHFYEILALNRSATAWSVVWNARGPKPLPDLEALRAALRGGSAPGWNQQWVKGDF